MKHHNPKKALDILYIFIFIESCISMGKKKGRSKSKAKKKLPKGNGKMSLTKDS